MNTDRFRPGLPPRDAARLRDNVDVLATLENPWAVPAMESSRGAEGFMFEMDPGDIAVELATPILVPTTITTDQNNWLPPDLWPIITASGTPSITGIPKPPPNTYQLLTITNAPGSSTPLLIPHDSGSSSTGNRIKTPDGTTYPVRPGDTIRLLYDPVTEYWWILADPPPVKFSDSTTFDGNLILNGSTTIGSGGTFTTHGSATATFNGPVTFTGTVTGGSSAAYDFATDDTAPSSTPTVDNLNVVTFAANYLNANKDKIEFDYTLELKPDATSQSVTLSFDGVDIFAATYAVPTIPSILRIWGWLVRVTSTTFRATVSHHADSNATPTGAVVQFTADSTDFTATAVLQLEVVCGGAGDIVSKMATIKRVYAGA